MAEKPINLFALVDDEVNPIRRIPVTGPLQQELTVFLGEQNDKFYSADTEKVNYSGGYRIEEGEINQIKNFPIDEHILDAIKNPMSYSELDLRTESHKIKALFFGEIKTKGTYVSFQVFDGRKLLNKGFTILNSHGTYTKLKDPGITLQNSLTTVYVDGELLFYSFFNARRIFDLTEYYTEATDSEIEQFAQNGLFEVESMDDFKSNADQIIRKKIAILQQNEVLKNVTVNDLKKTAAGFSIQFQIKKNKIVIPNDRKQLKDLIRFLDEEFYIAPISKRKCLANSKRYV